MSDMLLKFQNNKWYGLNDSEWLEIVNPDRITFDPIELIEYTWNGKFDVAEYCLKCAEAEMCIDEVWCSAKKKIELYN